MQEAIINKIEETFRISNSPEELFDSFQLAIAHKIKDPELYKMLLRNKALSTDEISMFAEKVCELNPSFSYNIYFCVAQLFASISSYGKHCEKAFSYFKKAAKAESHNHAPYLAVTKMYNPDFNMPDFEDLTFYVRSGIEYVDEKSKLCFALANLYKSKGDTDSEKIYKRLGEHYQKEGR